MTGSSRKFHIDTVISAMVGKTLSPIAEKEYFDLCSFLLQGKIPKNEDDSFAHTSDINGIIMCGLIHQYPEIHKGLMQTPNGSEKDPSAPPTSRELLSLLKKSVHATLKNKDEFIDVEPFSAAMHKEISSSILYIRIALARIMGDQMITEGAINQFEGMQGAMTLAYPQVDILTPEFKESFSAKISPSAGNPSKVSRDETANLPKFEEYTFASDILGHVLAIAKAVKIPVTAESFKKLNLKIKDDTVLAVGIDVSESNYEPLRQHLVNAGIGDHLHKAKAKESGRVMLAINLKELDKKSISVIGPLSEYRNKVAGNWRG